MQMIKNMGKKEAIESLRESGVTYEGIGKLYGISRQRVHQIIKHNIESRIKFNKKRRYKYNELRRLGLPVSDAYILRDKSFRDFHQIIAKLIGDKTH